jgi:hypothetical protein
MSKIRPLGKLQFSKSAAADVIAYNLYGAPVPKKTDGTDDTPPVLDYSANFLGQFPAPDATQETVVIDLSTVNGLMAADGEDFVFAVASQDAAGNISDMSATVIHPLDETPPDAPTNLVWIDG